jgi:membrane protein YdbS with pleckstrin-like domain
MKIPEKGAVYKTSRVAYMQNYVIAALVAILLVLIFPYLNFTIFITNISELISYLIVFGLIIVITFMFEEPTIERWIRRYVVTNNEVMKIEGIIRKKKFAIPMQSIADVKLSKGIVGRIFNFGNIEIMGFKEGISMKGIRNPDEVLRMIENKVNLMRTKVIKRPEVAGE